MPKILIADDDTNFLDFTSNLLQKAGFEVIQVKSPDEMIQKTELNKPDLILLDITLKKAEDGIVAGKELYKKGIKIPIIILDSVSNVANLNIDTSEISIEAYAEKPLNEEKIIIKIKAILNREPQ